MNFLKYILWIIIPLIYSSDSNAQNRNSVWCFGDSAAIDFSSGNPVTGSSSLDSRGTCVSIADTNSNLLFYGNTRSGVGGGNKRINMEQK